MTTEQLVRARIAVELTNPANATVKDAITMAAWKALEEAKQLNWKVETQAAVVETFLNTGVQMMEEAVTSIEAVFEDVK